MLETTYDGLSLLHRVLWKVVEKQAKISVEQKQGSFYTNLVSTVFAFHTIEAYLNYIGELIAPLIWQDERNFFRKDPYRGFNGKLKKVLELVGLPWPEPVTRPLETVLKLKELRDLIAHAKPERYNNIILHAEDTEPPLIIPTINKLVTEQFRKDAIFDVEMLLNHIHSNAAPLVKDPLFGAEALPGSTSFIARTTVKKP
jgi:hypothetical protein